MNTNEIFSAALAALTLIAGFAAVYYKGNNRLIKAVTGFITEAETTYTDMACGGIKMQYVCGRLYALLPALLRPFIPQAVIQTVVQAIFDEMAVYARAQLDRAAKTLTEPAVQTDGGKAG